MCLLRAYFNIILSVVYKEIHRIVDSLMTNDDLVVYPATMVVKQGR